MREFGFYRIGFSLNLFIIKVLQKAPHGEIEYIKIYYMSPLRSAIIELK